MKALLIVGVVLAVPVAVVTVYGLVHTHRVGKDPRQRIFRHGHLPEPGPDGLYRGTVPGREVPWKGKKFSASDNTGINLFLSQTGGAEERYPFRTHVGDGVKDKGLRVLKIDYDIPGNPRWLRRILDEVVEVEPGKLLGKIHVRWILGMTFSLGYFELEKAP